MSHMFSDELSVASDNKTRVQTVSMLAAVGLLILTSTGNAGLMFWVSLAALLLLSIWFTADRKIWLAVISGLTFLAAVFSFARSLF